MRNFFVSGTDTDAGKTYATCALIAAFGQRGMRAMPMKPVAAGTIRVDGIDINEDVVALREVSACTSTLADINPYCFSEPIAPHIAAQRESVVVDMAVIRAAFSRISVSADTVLVEGAGGFLVPLSNERSMAEIPAALSLEVILVVGMRLGVLNHALLTVEAIRSRGLTLAGWIANHAAAGPPMAAYEENIATLKRLIDGPMLGTLARDDETNDVKERARLAAVQLNIDPLLST